MTSSPASSAASCQSSLLLPELPLFQRTYKSSRTRIRVPSAHLPSFYPWDMPQRLAHPLAPLIAAWVACYSAFCPSALHYRTQAGRAGRSYRRVKGRHQARVCMPRFSAPLASIPPAPPRAWAPPRGRTHIIAVAVDDGNIYTAAPRERRALRAVAHMPGAVERTSVGRAVRRT